MTEKVDVMSQELFKEVLRSPIESKAYPLLGGYETAYNEQGEPEVVYMSTPITTGPGMVDYLRAGGDSNPDLNGDLVRSEVIAANMEALPPVRDNIAGTFRNDMLIDPTEVTVDGWSQREYMRFWAEVIELYADQMVMADGWELSTGCTFEFMLAWEIGIPVYDSECKMLDNAHVLELLNNAINTLDEVGRDSQMQAECMELMVSDLVEEYTL